MWTPIIDVYIYVYMKMKRYDIMTVYQTAKIKTTTMAAYGVWSSKLIDWLLVVWRLTANIKGVLRTRKIQQYIDIIMTWRRTIGAMYFDCHWISMESLEGTNIFAFYSGCNARHFIEIYKWEWINAHSVNATLTMVIVIWQPPWRGKHGNALDSCGVKTCEYQGVNISLW